MAVARLGFKRRATAVLKLNLHNSINLVRYGSSTNDVFIKLEPSAASVYQNSTTFHGNSKYGVTKSCGLFVCRKSLENVKSPGRQWVNV